MAIKPTKSIEDWAEALQALFDSRQYDALRKQAEACCREYPDNAFAYFMHGNAIRKQGHYEAAIDDFKKAVTLKPDYAYAYFYIGSLHDRLHRYEEAIKAYDKAIALDPHDQITLSNREVAKHKLRQSKQ